MTESLSRYVHLLSLLVSLLLLYQFLGVFTFYDSAGSAQFNWAMSGTRHTLVSRVRHCSPQVHVDQSKIFVLLHADLQAKNVPRHCRQWHHQPKKHLDIVDKDTTECVEKDKAPIPRRGDAPPTPRWRPPCSADAPLTPLPGPDGIPDARPLATPLPRRSNAPPTQRSGRDEVAPAPSWRPSHAAMTQLPRSNDAPYAPTMLRWPPRTAANGGGPGGSRWGNGGPGNGGQGMPGRTRWGLGLRAG